MQVFSDVKLQCITVGPKTLVTVVQIRRKQEYWAMNRTEGYSLHMIHPSNSCTH